MSSRSATVLVILVVALVAFCLASVFAAMTGPISILPNESDSTSVLDNLSAITDSDDSYPSYGSDDSNNNNNNPQSSSEGSQSGGSQIETTTDDSNNNNNNPQSSSEGSESGGSQIETTTDDRGSSGSGSQK